MTQKLNWKRYRVAIITLFVFALGSAIQLSLLCGAGDNHSHAEQSTTSTESSKSHHHEHADGTNHSHTDNKESTTDTCCDDIDLKFISSLGLDHSSNPSSVQILNNHAASIEDSLSVDTSPKLLGGTSTSPPERNVALHIRFTILLI